MSEAPQPLNALPQGYRLQEYELVRVLGFGGFGMTYLGFDHNLDKPVAIKEYLPSDIAVRTADRSVAPQASEFRGDFQWGLDRFVDEARTLARFDHRHIIKVHRFFEAHGTAYIVMEYAEGETLSAHLERKGPLQEAELKAILYPLLNGLEVVHGADFLHRDIKPGNIVLRDVDGSPVLLDFGAARQAIGAKSRSVTSIGTPGYAPIEQYSSRGRQGPWTDIYALGGVCYRALTGEVPEDATDRVRDDPLVPVAQRCAGRASGAFLSAVDWALSVDEGDRPQRVGAWLEAMEGAAEKEVEDAPRVGRVEQDRSPQKQKKPRWVAVAFGVVAVLVGGIMYGEHVEQQRQEQAALEKQRQEQAALEKQRREQAALEKQRQEQAALEKQRQEQAALEKQRQEQAFVAVVGRKPHPRGMYKDATDLHIAAAVLNLPVLTRSLIAQGADVHAQDNFGNTPLHWAAEVDASATATVLLEQGADVHAQDNFGNTPLHRAAEVDASATATVLLDNGAQVNAKNNNDVTPLHWAAYRDASATATVLLDNGAQVNAKSNFGNTPLYGAAEVDASAMAQVLLDNGAQVNAKNNDGWTPLHVAAWEDASATVKVLLDHGADVHAQDNDGNTPLHYAAWEDASATAKVLLENGADVNAQDNDGNTPRSVATEKNASATAAVLRRYGGRE